MKNNHTTKPNAVVYVWQQNERSDHFETSRKVNYAFDNI